MACRKPGKRAVQRRERCFGRKLRSEVAKETHELSKPLAAACCARLHRSEQTPRTALPDHPELIDEEVVSNIGPSLLRPGVEAVGRSHHGDRIVTIGRRRVVNQQEPHVEFGRERPGRLSSGRPRLPRHDRESIGNNDLRRRRCRHDRRRPGSNGKTRHQANRVTSCDAGKTLSAHRVTRPEHSGRPSPRHNRQGLRQSTTGSPRPGSVIRPASTHRDTDTAR